MAGTSRWEKIKSRKSGRERTGRRIRYWAQAVKRRDNYTCVLCGKRDPKNVDADHIIPLKDGGDPFSLDNGRTICIDCHAKEDSTGKGYIGARKAMRAKKHFTKKEDEKNN
jgi:5-methylcytosine-specific restriction endonuclease McrA